MSNIDVTEYANDSEWSDINWEPNVDGTYTLTRTVWKKAHRVKDRDILRQETLLVLDHEAFTALTMQAIGSLAARA